MTETTDSTFDPERPLGEIVRDAPETARVFESLGIDYCCGGDATLEAACAEAELDVSSVREELEAARRESDDTGDDWESPSDLADHIVSTHHEYLSEELPSLEDLVRKVRRVHGDNHPELAEVEETFLELAEEMRTHTAEEEDEVFPVVRKLDRGESLTEAETETLREAIADLEDDHEETAAHLERIADLTDDYAVPDDACPSYRNMLERLEELERETHTHVHKENNVLFPEAEERLVADS